MCVCVRERKQKRVLGRGSAKNYPCDSTRVNRCLCMREFLMSTAASVLRLQSFDSSLFNPFCPHCLVDRREREREEDSFSLMSFCSPFSHSRLYSSLLLTEGSKRKPVSKSDGKVFKKGERVKRRSGLEKKFRKCKKSLSLS